eukprot:Gregarina_sp_Poly_1__4972@NODE_2636_length_1890_cov_565_399890_g1672_i0_p2_GENE_NODE_2636_length_1890_cov_565_399890_g1672_i0NODE_2636_length_1890_cov_565_399890_g1672_i0_p2_ORF_typecomplete_len146_score22_97AHSA1/PF08327_11/3_2e08_NODE_2636_length_1890_cov_565_399890_g1672_i0152589
MPAVVDSSLIFNVPARIVYESLATQEGLSRLALGKETKFPEEVGAHFSLLGGELFGKIEALKPNELVQLQLKRRGWTAASHVQIELSPYNGREDRTLVHLIHSDVPIAPNATELATQNEIKAMWESQFWDVLDKVFGYGRDNLED